MAFPRPPSFPRASLLLLSTTGVQALLPSTLISQVEALVESHKLEDACKVAEQRRKKLEENITIDEDEAEELRYVYQLIGFQYFAETLFEDAGKHLFNGEVDPRIVASYYPDLRGNLFNPEDSMDVFAGVAERMPKERSIDDIIMNYSPHLAPNTLSAPPTAELRKILGMAAREMLLTFLKKSRARRSIGRGLGTASEGHQIDVTIDTILAKLYAEFERTAELYDLLQSHNDVKLSEVEYALVKSGQYSALCTLYKQGQEDGKLLEAWAKLVDGEWSDDDIVDPLSQIINFLSDKRDKALSQRWGLWLTKRDPDRGLKLLMQREGGKRREKPEDDLALLDQIQAVNPSAGSQYLEHIVLQRRNPSRELLTRLLKSCIEQVLSFLQDDNVSKLWRAKASSYASTHKDMPFLSYFVSTTPQSDHKRARLKLILLLAGSTVYDPAPAYEQLSQQKNVLQLELAIICGKMNRHKEALETLIHVYSDNASAEMYCTLAGDIVPPRIAQVIADDAGLQDWTSTLFSLPPSAKNSVGKAPLASAPSIGRLKTVNQDLKKQLLKILLEVYMTHNQPDRAAQLLNAQAMNLDVLDVIAIVPPQWPVGLMSTFLARSLRRTLHAEHEGDIVKNISAAQNLEIKDRTWHALREQGSLLEEEADDDEDEDEGTDDENGPRFFSEKTDLGEKLSVIEISPSGDVVAGKLSGTRSIPTDSLAMEYPT